MLIKQCWILLEISIGRNLYSWCSRENIPYSSQLRPALTSPAVSPLVHWADTNTLGLAVSFLSAKMFSGRQSGQLNEEEMLDILVGVLRGWPC